jgi:class 3 adenylate cyclase
VSRRVQTLLFTDIVGSTDRLRDLGDAAWAALLARHHEVIRAVLAAHGGREVNTVGDGFLARFDAPAPAVRAAAGAVAGVAPLGVEIRVGLHAGEVELEGTEVAGVGVHLAARVMAEAGAGQVLVSSTVRDRRGAAGAGAAPPTPSPVTTRGGGGRPACHACRIRCRPGSPRPPAFPPSAGRHRRPLTNVLSRTASQRFPPTIPLLALPRQ